MQNIIVLDKEVITTHQVSYRKIETILSKQFPGLSILDSQTTDIYQDLGQTLKDTRSSTIVLVVSAYNDLIAPLTTIKDHQYLLGLLDKDNPNYERAPYPDNLQITPTTGHSRPELFQIIQDLTDPENFIQTYIQAYHHVFEILRTKASETYEELDEVYDRINEGYYE